MNHASIALLLASVFQAAVTSAQTDPSERLRMPNQTVYVEFGGNAGYLSVNYDRKLNEHFTGRIGYGHWARLDIAGDQPSEYARLVPLMVNYLPRPAIITPHWFEIGGGLVFGDRWSSDNQNRHQSVRAATAILGYRGMTRLTLLRLSVALTSPLGTGFPGAHVRPGGSWGLVF